MGRGRRTPCLLWASARACVQPAYVHVSACLSVSVYEGACVSVCVCVCVLCVCLGV